MRACAAVLLLGAALLADDDPVPALLVRLDSAKAGERVQATRALGRIDDARALDAVRRAQADASEGVRHEAAIALAKAGKADAKSVEILVRSLGAEDWYTRWQACLGLRATGKLAEPAVPALIMALGDGAVDASREAALALATIAPKDKRTIAALRTAIEGGKGDRTALYHAIGRCGEAAAGVVPVLIREVGITDPNCREAAFEALRSIAPRSVETYAALLDSEEAGARVFGARGLGATCSEKACAHLGRAMGDASTLVRFAAARAAKEMGPLAWKALPGLVPLLADESLGVRELAQEAIAAAGAPELSQLVDRSFWTRRRSVFGVEVSCTRVELVTLKLPYWDKEDYTGLLATLTDPVVGKDVLQALSQIPLELDSPELVRALLSRGPIAGRRCAILLLPAVAKRPGFAKAALKNAAKDPDLKDDAKRALAELEARK